VASEEIRADLLLGRDTLSPGLVKAGEAASHTSSDVKQLTKDLYELGKQRATPIVDLNDKDADARLSGFVAKLKELSAKVADPGVDLNDKDAVAKLATFRVQLAQLAKQVASPRITLEGLAKFEAKLLGIDAQLDKLDGREVNVHVDVDRRGGLPGLLGGGIGGIGRGIGALAGLAGTGAQSVGSGIGAAGNALGQSLQGAAIAAAIGTGAVLTPALLPVLLGGGIGLGGAAGGIALGSAANKQLQALGKQLQSSSLTRSQRQDIRGQMAALRRQQAGPLAAFGGFQDLAGALKDTFSSAITSRGPGFSGGPGGHPGGESFVSGLAGILKQIAGFIKSIGPQLGEMFRASLPFLQAFVGFLEKAAKALLPAFTQMLKEMAPYLPVITQGLLDIVKGFAGFLNAIGPSGMKASARIFVIFAEGIAAALVGIGHALNWLAENVPKWTRFITSTFRTWRHETAVIFDGVRHEIAHVWDMVWNNTIGRLERGIRDFYHLGAQFRHSVANQFDTIRHDIAAVWDTIWRNTVTRAQHGIDDVVTWFKSLPGRAIRALEGLGTSLYNFGHMALTKLWNGLKSVFSSVWSWFKSLPGKLLHAIGIASPPGWAIEAGKHIMGGLLKGITSRRTELQRAFASSVKFHPGAGVQQWAGLVRRALAMEGLSPALLPRVLYQMQTESGGNPNAINNWDVNARMGDPSRGLLQVIGSTFQAYHWPGTSWNIFNPLANIAAALNYARHVYGPALMSGGMGIGSGHGYASGGWITEPIFGIGRSGRAYTFGERGPELVTPGGRGGGNHYTINVSVPPNANMRDIGRVTVQAIKVYEQGSGSGWRR
jgi:SLT domain-containing protein